MQEQSKNLDKKHSSEDKNIDEVSESDNSQPTQTESKKSPLKKAGTIAGYVLGAAALYGGVSEIVVYKWRADHQEMYGTVSNPTYSINYDFPDLPNEFEQSETDFNNPCENYENKVRLLEVLDGIVENLEQQVANSQLDLDNYEHIDRIDQQNIRTRLCERWLSASEKSSRLLSVNISILSDPLRDLSNDINASILRYKQTEGTPQELAIQDFEGLIGLDFPQNIQFVHEDQSEGVGGYHEAIRGIISSEGGEDIMEYLILLHEGGHAAAQHSEQLACGKVTGLFREDNTDSSVIEEACAMAFMGAGIQRRYSTDEEFASLAKFVFEAKIHGQVHRHYEGEIDEHYQAAHVYLATREVLQDPQEVFNCLATLQDSSLENLSDEIQQRMQEREEQFRFNQTFRVQFDRRYIRIQELEDELSDLYEQVPETTYEVLPLDDFLEQRFGEDSPQSPNNH